MLPPGFTPILAEGQRVTMHSAIILSSEQPPGIDTVFLDEGRDHIEQENAVDFRRAVSEQRPQLVDVDAQTSRYHIGSVT